MLDEPRTNLAHSIAAADDFTIGISDDGTRHVIEHVPSGETVEFGPDGLDTGVINSDELSIGTELTTSPSDTVSDINQTLSSMGGFETLNIIHPLTVGDTPILLPSNTTLKISAEIKRGDNVATGGGFNLIENTDPTNGNENIKVIFDGGRLNGNTANQSATANCFPFLIQNVNGLEIRDADIYDNLNWGGRFEDITNGRIYGWYVKSLGNKSNQDGIHFIDSSELVLRDISGTSEDDLLAITSESKTTENIIVSGVEGTSMNANGVRLNIPTTDVGDGVSRTLQNISISGIDVHDVGSSGVVLQNSDANTTYKNVNIEGAITNPTDMGFQGLSGGGVMEKCSVDLIIDNPTSDAFNLENANSVKDCEFTIHSYKASGTRPAALMANVVGCDLNIYSQYDDIDNQNVALQSGSENHISGHFVGGSRGIQLGTGASAMMGNIISDVVIEDTANQAIFEVDSDDDYNLITDYQIVNCGSGISLSGLNSSDTGDGIVR